MMYRRGFSLMEILIVIIAIAVLADVAGPYVAEVADKGRTTATKQQMENLKKALMRYKMDLGRYPHLDAVYNASTINDMGASAMSFYYSNPDHNPLTSDNRDGEPARWQFLGLRKDGSGAPYWKRWKGPYMDTAPEEFLADAWGEGIIYCHYNKAIWLQSVGADGESAAPTCFQPNHETDDIVVFVAPTKF